MAFATARSVRSLVAQIRLCRTLIALAKNHNHQYQPTHCSYRQQAHDSQNCGAVACRRWVVLKTEEQHLVDGHADLPLRRVDESQSQIADRKFNSIKIEQNEDVRIKQ